MFDISRDNVISITRGDSAKFPLFINTGTELKPIRYVLEEGDEVYLAIMQPNQYFENAIVKKKYTDEDLNDHGDVLIKIRPEDTEQLIPGKYYYQIKSKLRTADGYEVHTVIKKTEFFIVE